MPEIRMLAVIIVSYLVAHMVGLIIQRWEISRMLRRQPWLREE